MVPAIARGVEVCGIRAVLEHLVEVNEAFGDPVLADSIRPVAGIRERPLWGPQFDNTGSQCSHC